MKDGEPRDPRLRGNAEDAHSDEHPDELLHRARVGLPLTPRERLITRDHLRTCDVCRLLEETRADLLDEAARPSDGKSITALVAATMASFQAPAAPVPAAPPSPARRSGRGRHAARLPAFAAGAVCLVAGVALAARWMVESPPATRAQEELSSHTAARERRAVVRPVPAPADAPAPPVQPDVAPPAAPALAVPAPPGAASSGGAAMLFARATEARRAGRVDEARVAYDRLWRDFPETVEARTGQVAYGRWLLDRHEARPAAAAFDDYLRGNPDGTLAAEAAVGLAEARESLGDREQARRAWEQVLANPAASAFTRHARARLRALEARAGLTTDGARAP